MAELSYRRHRFPPVVIQHAIWLDLRFTLSYRDVEDLLAERGLDVSLRDSAALGAEIRSHDRAQSAAPPSPERSMASRRDGGPDCQPTDVPVARRRSRGRGSRHAGSRPAPQAGGTPADVQAPQETRLRAEIAGYRQARFLWSAFPATPHDLPS